MTVTEERPSTGPIRDEVPNGQKTKTQQQAFAGQPVNWPKFAFLAVDDLSMDQRYQRHLNRRQADKIAEEFDADLFGAITVSPQPDGRYAVIDGQHRTVGAAMRGIDLIPAFITSTVTAQDEATTYVAINTLRKATTPYQTWVAAAFADETSSEARANAILAKHDMRVANTGATSKTGAEKAHQILPIKAVGTLKWILNRGGVELLEDTVSIIDLHWRGSDNCVADKLIKGLAYFLWIYEDKIVWDKLNYALEAELKNVNTMMTPTRILQKASTSFQGAQPAVVANMFMKSYNARNKTKHQYRDTRPKATTYKGFNGGLAQVS